MIVTALADPEPRMGMIDRILVAAYDARTSPILCLTKWTSPPKISRVAYAPLISLVVVTRPAAISPRSNPEQHTTRC